MSEFASEAELNRLVANGMITQEQADQFRGKTLQEVMDYAERNLQKKAEGWDRL